MSARYEVIIVGAGHNGLVAAAKLAQDGHSVLVLEQRKIVGGAAATEEIFPGYRFNTGSDDAGLFQEEIAHDLLLEMHGLSFKDSPAAVFAPQTEGPALTLWRDEARTVANVERFSERDASRYGAFARQVNDMAQMLRRMFLITPPALDERKLGDVVNWGQVGWSMKRMGDEKMMAFLRLLPIPVSEYLDEWFESELLKGALGAPGVMGSHLGPRSAGTTLMMLYQNSSGLHRSRFVTGGMGRLAEVLVSAARSSGAEIRTGAPVQAILLQEGCATGVRLANGEEISSRLVASSADPRRTFFDLVGPTHLSPRFMREVRNIIYRGSTAKVNLALNGLPSFKGQESVEQLSGHVRICPSLEYLERAYDDAKYGRLSSQPMLDIVIPTVMDPSLAPAGHHVMSIRVQYAPYDLRGANWEEQRQPLGDLVMDLLAQYAPGIEELVEHRQVLTPLDWEQEYGLTEGSIFHGQMGLDQLLVMRPVPGWSQYRTPIEHLYLCGAGTHPGGGVTGAPGYNAAREIGRALEG